MNAFDRIMNEDIDLHTDINEISECQCKYTCSHKVEFMTDIAAGVQSMRQVSCVNQCQKAQYHELSNGMARHECIECQLLRYTKVKDGGRVLSPLSVAAELWGRRKDYWTAQCISRAEENIALMAIQVHAPIDHSAATRHNSSAASGASGSSPAPAMEATAGIEPPPELTPEQRRTMEANRAKALARRGMLARGKGMSWGVLYRDPY